MADLPSNEDILRDYFDSDDNDSDLRDFQKLNQIYRYLKNQVVKKKAKKKVNQSQKMRMNGLTRCVASMLNDFTKRLGLCFLQISTFKQQPQRTITI